MTIEEAKEIVRAVSFCGAFSGVVVDIYPSETGAVLETKWHLPDRNEPSHEISIARYTEAEAVRFVLMEKWEILDWIHREFRQLVDHEQGEAFLVGGRRILDPHAALRSSGGRRDIFRGVFA